MARPGGSSEAIQLIGDRMTIGRLPELNDIALQPDPELLVSRASHCVLELAASRWFVSHGGGVNGTFLRRGSSLSAVKEREMLQDGDVICVLAQIPSKGERRYFELAFRADRDSQATRPAPITGVSPGRPEPKCLKYTGEEARLVLMSGDESQEIKLRAQAHRLVRYMADRNAEIGSAALCTHDELMHAVWAEEPMHSREELAKIVWEIRRQLAPLGAEHLLENERGLGYRMISCSGKLWAP